MRWRSNLAEGAGVLREATSARCLSRLLGPVLLGQLVAGPQMTPRLDDHGVVGVILPLGQIGADGLDGKPGTVLKPPSIIAIAESADSLVMATLAVRSMFAPQRRDCRR